MAAEHSLKNSFTYFGILLCLEGFLFLILPHITVRLLCLSPIATDQAEQYARVAGIAISVIGYYYIVAGIHMLIPFYRYSIMARPMVLPLLGALVYFGFLELPFIVFGVQDLIGTYWSYQCLKLYEADEKNGNKIKRST